MFFSWERCPVLFLLSTSPPPPFPGWLRSKGERLWEVRGSRWSWSPFTSLELPGRSHLPRGLLAQMVKNQRAVWETRLRSLGWEDPLEESMATGSTALAWRIPWTEGPGGAAVHMGSHRVGQDWATSTFIPSCSDTRHAQKVWEWPV